MQNEYEYDVKKIFEELESELIKSMKRNLGRHLAEEKAEGFNWPQWQALKLKELHKYKKENKEIFNNHTKGFNRNIYKHIKSQFKEGASRTNKEAIKAGFINKEDSQLGGSFFGLNHRKLDALIKSTKEDMKDVKYATLRMMNDEYRQTIFKAQVYANTGTGTIKQAVDMATKDFLAKGINCIEYKDGRRVNIADYCDMVIRTADKRANLMGEGELRKRLGVSTVYVSKHGTSCDMCGKWEGRVYIDDVWSGGKAEDGKYPLLSKAIDGGLMHPRCRHGLSTYYEGINDEPKEVTEAKHNHDKDDEYTQYLQRRMKQYERMAVGSLFPDNVQKYKNKADELKNKINCPYVDITDNFKEKREYIVEEQQYFIDKNNNKYNIDGRNVKIKANKREREVADIIGKLYGGKIKLIPVVLNPKGIKTPDYTVNGIAFDLKEPIGNSKNTLDGVIKDNKEQAKNFILGLTRTKMTREEALIQVDNIYNSKYRNWVDTIILIDGKEVIKIFKRK